MGGNGSKEKAGSESKSERKGGRNEEIESIVSKITNGYVLKSIWRIIMQT